MYLHITAKKLSPLTQNTIILILLYSFFYFFRKKALTISLQLILVVSFLFSELEETHKIIKIIAIKEIFFLVLYY